MSLIAFNVVSAHLIDGKFWNIVSLAGCTSNIQNNKLYIT